MSHVFWDSQYVYCLHTECNLSVQRRHSLFKSLVIHFVNVSVFKDKIPPEIGYHSTPLVIPSLKDENDPKQLAPVLTNHNNKKYILIIILNPVLVTYYLQFAW